jgi:hypothetical protein
VLEKPADALGLNDDSVVREPPLECRSERLLVRRTADQENPTAIAEGLRGFFARHPVG